MLSGWRRIDRASRADGIRVVRGVEKKTVGLAGSSTRAMDILVELLDRGICKPTENLTLEKRRHRGRYDFYVVALTPYPQDQTPYSDGSLYWLAIKDGRDEREAARKTTEDA